MARACDVCGEMWGGDVHCACYVASQGQPEPPKKSKRFTPRRPTHPDETGCPKELRGLGWREIQEDSFEPAWRAVVGHRDRVVGLAPATTEHPEWYTGSVPTLDIATLTAIAAAERREAGIPYIDSQYLPRFNQD